VGLLNSAFDDRPKIRQFAPFVREAQIRRGGKHPHAVWESLTCSSPCCFQNHLRPAYIKKSHERLESAVSRARLGMGMQPLYCTSSCLGMAHPISLPLVLCEVVEMTEYHFPLIVTKNKSRLYCNACHKSVTILLTSLTVLSKRCWIGWVCCQYSFVSLPLLRREWNEGNLT
jgi:hypothetical protein